MKQNCLQIANELVGGDRNNDYGHPFHDFSRTAKIWGAILGVEVTPEQVALCLVGVKISRECNKPKDDNVVDGCGYFRTLEMVKEFRAGRESIEKAVAAQKVATVEGILPTDSKELQQIIRHRHNRQ